MWMAVKLEEQKSLGLSRTTRNRHTLQRLLYYPEARELAPYIRITWFAAKTPAIRAKGLASSARSILSPGWSQGLLAPAASIRRRGPDRDLAVETDASLDGASGRHGQLRSSFGSLAEQYEFALDCWG